MQPQPTVKDRDQELILKLVTPKASRWILAGLLILFVAQALLADLYPLKNIYCFFNEGVMAFTELDDINPGMRYCGGGSNQMGSWVWGGILKLVTRFISSRAISLRLVSIVATVCSLLILFRLARRLYSPPVGLVFIFLLVTSPVFVESMRAWGWAAFCHLIVVAAAFTVVSSLNNRWVTAKSFLLAFICYLTFSLYVVTRLAIFLPLLFFGFYFRRQWWKLSLFLFFLVAMIIGVDVVSADGWFDLRGFFTCSTKGSLVADEWLFGDGAAALEDRLQLNLGLAGSYLFGIARESFADKNWHSRLFNEFYIPFLIIGIPALLKGRSRSRILLLIWLALFFILPLATFRIEPRRILFGIYPIYLIIALGIRYLYRFLVKVPILAEHRKGLAGLLLSGLLLVGAVDVHDFFAVVARPDYAYSREQLEKLADQVVELGRQADLIVYAWPVDNLIWGNPYLIDHPGSLELNWMEFYERRPLKVALNNALDSRKKLLYFYSFNPHPYATDYYRNRLESDLKWSRNNLSDKIKAETIGDIDLHYIFLNRFAD